MAGNHHRTRLLAALVALCLATSGCAWLARSSVPRDPGLTVGPASLAGISESGRYTLFGGDLSDYVDVPFNPVRQALLRDNILRTTEVVSISTTGERANAFAVPVAMSDDARYITFRSAASNLAPGDGDGLTDVFVRDRTAGTTTLVSVNDDESPITDLDAHAYAMSGDGNVVAFHLQSPGIAVPPAVSEIAVRNLRTGTTRLLPHLHDAPSSSIVHLSGDGSLVAYGDVTTNPNTVWLGIARTDTGTLIRDLGSAATGIGNAFDVQLSADGNRYALVDGRHQYDATSTGTVTVGRVDGSTPSTVHHYRWAAEAVLNRDGSVLGVEILLANGMRVLAVDRGAEPPLVVSADSTGTKPVAVDGGIDLSADGKWVAFVSNANETLGGHAGDTAYAVYTRSVAPSLSPPS